MSWWIKYSPFFLIFLFLQSFAQESVDYLVMAGKKYPLNVFTIIPSDAASKHAPTHTLPAVLRRIRSGSIQDGTCLAISTKSGVKRIVTLYKGVEAVKDERIIVFSRGYIPLPGRRSGNPRCGGGVCWVHRLVQNNILPNAVWVTFDYIDDAAVTDFGQGNDQRVLKTVIQEVRKKNPQARITLVGDCRGAHAALRYLAMHDDPYIDSLILESPYESTTELIARVSESYLAPYFGRYAHPLFSKFFCWFYSHYDAARDDLPDMLNRIKGKKIFIGHHLNDRVISQKNVEHLCTTLSHNNELYFFASADKMGDHSRMSFICLYQNALNCFCADVGLSHQPHLAENKEGILASLLHRARSCLSFA